MHSKTIPAGTIIKPKDIIFNEVFVICAGQMGLYTFPYGQKTLMTTLKAKEVIGEWNFNFIYSKAAEYEAITDMQVILFDREDYEKVNSWFCKLKR